MTKTQNINCEKYKIFNNLKILYIWFESNNDKIFKEQIKP